MKTSYLLILTFSSISALDCGKSNSATGPSPPPTPSMSGRWAVTWTGWFALRTGTLNGSMNLTETDSALSGSIIIESDTFSVAGKVTSSLNVTLAGTDGGYDYTIFGSVNSSKNSLNGNAQASHMGSVPKDTVGSATMVAVRH